MNKIIPNHVPSASWKGGFIENHPELQYQDGIADLSTLTFKDNLDRIDSINRQQHVLWPEFTRLTVQVLGGTPQKKRCRALQGYRLLSKKSKPSV